MQTEFKVESGIPLPSKESSNIRHNQKYPWHLMKKGDSFLVESNGNLTKKKIEGRLTVLKYSRLRKYDEYYEVRVAPKGVRIWKVK